MTSHDSSYDHHLHWLTSQVHDLNRKITDLEQRLSGVPKEVRCLVYFLGMHLFCFYEDMT